MKKILVNPKVPNNLEPLTARGDCYDPQLVKSSSEWVSEWVSSLWQDTLSVTQCTILKPIYFAVLLLHNDKYSPVIHGLTKRRRASGPGKSQRVAHQCLYQAVRQRTICLLHAQTGHSLWPVCRLNKRFRESICYNYTCCDFEFSYTVLQRGWVCGGACPSPA